MLFVIKGITTGTTLTFNITTITKLAAPKIQFSLHSCTLKKKSGLSFKTDP